MKTQLLTILAIVGLQSSHGARITKSKRGYLLGGRLYNTPSVAFGDDLNLSQTGWKVNTGDFSLDVELPGPRRLPPVEIQKPRILSRPISSYGIISNSLDKPVMENQEYISPPPTGAVVLPPMPPPAIPVNAIAANVPASLGATYLGSGSIGVVSLGNGAYALGSGSLGYSENRSNPRPSAMVPVYPPIQAAPNLLPAAVPTPQPASPITLAQDYNLGQQYLSVPQLPQVDQNGYEYLPPNRVGFGQPNPPRPVRIRQQFATPTTLQLRPQLQAQQVMLPITHLDLAGI